MSDIITGDTNVTGSISVSNGSMHITQSLSVGRDTVSTFYLSALGQFAPLGIVDALIDFEGLAFDAGLPWKKGPFSDVPESIPVIKTDFKIAY